ncbi:MAG TPA: hypothetical protein ACN46V_02250 [Prochlorococcus sp.]
MRASNAGALLNAQHLVPYKQQQEGGGTLSAAKTWMVLQVESALIRRVIEELNLEQNPPTL